MERVSTVKEVRLGFIGTGGNARNHIRAMAEREDVRIVAFADPSEASLRGALDGLGREVPTYADYRTMIDSEELDAVVISTPHTLHYEQVITCLDRGLHVQVEKPMACSSADARAIIKKQQETGKVVLIGYQRHYEARFRWVRHQINSGVIGRLTYVQCYQSQNWLRGQQGKWRLIPELSGGGQLNDSGSHLVDVLLWMTGLEPEEVSAYVDFRGEQVDINSAINVRFKGGAIGNISIVGDQVAQGMWEDVTIAGEAGIIWMRQGGQVHIATEGSLKPTPVTDFTIEREDQSVPVAPTMRDAQFAKDHNFIDVILGKSTNQVPPICGLRVIELTEAVWRSAEAGKPVAVEKGDEEVVA